VHRVNRILAFFTYIVFYQFPGCVRTIQRVKLVLPTCSYSAVRLACRFVAGVSDLFVVVFEEKIFNLWKCYLRLHGGASLAF